MENAEDSVAGPLQCPTGFAEWSAKGSRRLVTMRKREQRSHCIVEAKRAKREQKKVQKKKARCGVFTSLE